MNELSLFTGAGGGLFGSHLLGWRTIGYVEIDQHCQDTVAQRIEDGVVPAAPIYCDIRAFIHRRTGYAQAHRGLVDVITGGFPCQPFSLAGRRQGEHDSRNMWPATRRCVGIVRPRWCLLENVPGLLAGSHGYFGTILRDLAAMGYDARWGIVSAQDVGAPHLRKRLWVVAYSVRDRVRKQSRRLRREGGSSQARPFIDGATQSLADSEGERIRELSIQPGQPQQASVNTGGGGQDVANAKCVRLEE